MKTLFVQYDIVQYVLVLLILVPFHVPRTAEEPEFITPERQVIQRCPSKRSPEAAMVPYHGKGKGKGGGKPAAKSGGKGKKGKTGKGKGKSKSPRPGLARATHLEDSASTEKYVEERPSKKN